jgi:hypothetical protein
MSAGGMDAVREGNTGDENGFSWLPVAACAQSRDEQEPDAR